MTDPLRKGPSGPVLPNRTDTITFSGGETRATGELNGTTGIAEVGDLLIGTPSGTNANLLGGFVLFPLGSKVHYALTAPTGAAAGVMTVNWANLSRGRR